MRPEVYFNIQNYTEQYGGEAAADIASFEISHVQVIKDLVEKEHIDCSFTLTRTMDVFLDEAYTKKAKVAYDELLKTGLASVEDVHFTPEKHAEVVRQHSYLFLAT